MPINTTDPLRCVTPATPEKPGTWIIHDPGDDAPDTGAVTDNNPDWAGPYPRHPGLRSAIFFMDGHIESLHPSMWCWSLSPWLQPATGGP
jgi:hypothetical protein